MKERATESGSTKNKGVLLCAVFAAACVLLGRIVPFAPWLFQLGVLLGVGGFLYLYIRFFVTAFFYEIEGTWLRVYKQTGKRSDIVSEVPISKIMSVTRGGQQPYAAEGVEPKVFNFCASPIPKVKTEVYALLEPGYADLLRLECSDAFYELLKTKQQRLCKGGPKEKKEEEK